MKTLNNLFSRNLIIPFAVLITILLSSCFNHSFESARMLKKREVDVKGFASYNMLITNDESAEGEGALVSGIGVGYGFSDKFNLKLNVSSFDWSGVMLELSPKFSIVQGRVAAALPIAVGIGESVSSPIIRPRVWFTAPSKNNKNELTLGIQSEIGFEKDQSPTLGLTLGYGFSKNLDKWSIRPEIGIAAALKDVKAGQVFNVGIGANYVFQGKKAKKQPN